MALSRKAHEILNREDLIQKRDLWYARMENLFYNRPDTWNESNVFCLSGINGRGQHGHDPIAEPELWMEDCLENLAERYEVLESEVCFRPLVAEYDPVGVHYIDKMLGANVYYYADQWYSNYLSTPIGELQPPDLDSNELWQATVRAMKAFVAADVALPHFGLPTYASALNIAVNLYGERILMEMVLEPENASKDLKTINDLLCELHRRSRAILPERQIQAIASTGRTQPPGSGQLCGCTTHLLSGGCYSELVAPLDDELLAVYPRGGLIHLCGAHTQHLEAFRNMPHLQAVQLNDRAADDLQAYYEELRDNQIIYWSPTEKTPLEKAMRITNGHRLICTINPNAPLLKKQQ